MMAITLHLSSVNKFAFYQSVDLFLNTEKVLIFGDYQNLNTLCLFCLNSRL